MKISISKRRNSPLNKKSNPHDEIVNHNEPNTFVSFTQIEKLGLNPSSQWSTPIGIYSYQLGYLIDDYFDADEKSIDAPFPAKQYRNFAWILRPKSLKKLIEIDSIGRDLESQLVVHTQRFVNKIAYKHGFPLEDGFYQDMEDQAEDSAGTDRGKFFWYYTHNIAEALAPELNIKVPIFWNKLLRSTGYDVWVDNGDGIIHPSEETQAVFLNYRNIQVVEKIKIKDKEPLPDLSDNYVSLVEEIQNSLVKLIKRQKLSKREWLTLTSSNNIDMLLDEIKYHYLGTLDPKVLHKIIVSTFSKLDVLNIEERFATKISSFMGAVHQRLLEETKIFMKGFAIALLGHVGPSTAPWYKIKNEKRIIAEILKSRYENPYLLAGLIGLSLSKEEADLATKRVIKSSLRHNLKILISRHLEND